jgi:hypothetical protein
MYRAPGWSTIGVVDRQTVVVRLELHLAKDEAEIADVVYEGVQ